MNDNFVLYLIFFHKIDEELCVSNIDLISMQGGETHVLRTNFNWDSMMTWWLVSQALIRCMHLRSYAIELIVVKNL